MKGGLSLIKPLLKKQWLETIYPYRKGNFSVGGFILRLLLVVAIVAVFVVFFSKFTAIYIAIRTGAEQNVLLRSSELLTLIYTCVIVFLVLGGVGKIGNELFEGDDIKLFSAMPIRTESIFASKLVAIYLSQLVISVIVVLSVNISFAAVVAQPWYYWLITVALCFALPLITIAIASLIVAPVMIVKRLLKDRFLLSFILVTLILAALFYVYAIVLGTIKDILVGEDLRYFFDERVMNFIALLNSFLYPARLISDLLIGRNVILSAILLVVVIAVGIACSALIIRKILIGALQARNQGGANYHSRGGKLHSEKSGVVALMKKDFLLIFRTPSYRFSYLSVAIVMPMMVYFCMSVGTSLVERLIGVECGFELAVFLTILLGALTNVFCATNISRDGTMFYSVKAYPLGYKTVFMSKVLLCLAVTAFSQLASAVVLLISGMITWYMALTLFVVGVLFGLVNIFVATKYDFVHAKFSTEEDGEIKESGNVVSIIVLLGLLISIVIGGLITVLRIIGALKGWNNEFFSYLIPLVGAAVATALSYFYFSFGLGSGYYRFEGGI